MNIAPILVIIAALTALALGVVYAGTTLIWKIIQKSTPSETAVGQVCWIQKAKIPGYRQLLFSCTKKGKPCEAISRPIWYKKKFKLKGMYQIKVFHRKIGDKGTTVWADPISDRKVSAPSAGRSNRRKRTDIFSGKSV